MTTLVVVGLFVLLVVSGYLASRPRRSMAPPLVKRPKPRPRHSVRLPEPGPFKGTITVTRQGKCVACKGPVLRGEWVRPTRRGWIGPCCWLTR